MTRLLRITVFVALLLALMFPAPPAFAASILRCQGEWITVRGNGACIRCHYTICCWYTPDGGSECSYSIDMCVDCITGVPV